MGHSLLFAVGAQPPHDGVRRARRLNLSRDLEASPPPVPAEAAARSRVERWMDWLLASLNASYLAGFRDAKKPEGERGASTAKDLAAELTLLEGALSQDWIAGPELSLADIALGPIVRRCLAFPFDKPALPRLEGWHCRLEQRPAFARAIAAG